MARMAAHRNAVRLSINVTKLIVERHIMCECISKNVVGKEKFKHFFIKFLKFFLRRGVNCLHNWLLMISISYFQGFVVNMFSMFVN